MSNENKNLIEGINELKNDSDFNMSPNELLNLKKVILNSVAQEDDSAINDEDKNFFQKLLNKFKVLRLQRRKLIPFALAFVIIIFSGVFFIVTNPGARNLILTKAFAVESTYPNSDSALHPVNKPLSITFTKEGLNTDLLKQNIDIEPDIQFGIIVDETDPRTVIIKPETNFVPNIQYTVKILAGEYGEGLTLDETYEYYFMTQGDNSLSLRYETMFWTDSFYNDKHNYELSISNYVNKFNNISASPQNVDLILYKTDSSEAFRAIEEFGYAAAVEEPNRNDSDYFINHSFNIDYSKAAEIYRTNVQTEVSQYDWNLKTELPIVDTGIYFLEVRAFDKVLKNNFVLINTVALQSRGLREDIAVTVSSLDNGKTIPSFPLQSYSLKKQEGIVGNGERMTDEKGQIILSSDYVLEDDLITGIYENQLLISSFSYELGTFSIDNYFVEPRSEKDLSRFQIITDRTLYRPGETVQYQVIGRKVINDKLVPYADDVIIKFNNDSQEEVFKLDANGILNGSYKIPEDIQSNFTSISVFEASDQRYFLGYRSFTVVSFDKPAYDIDVKLDKDEYFNGETVKVKASAAQYDGTILKNEKIIIQLNVSKVSWWNSDNYNICSNLFNYEYYYNYSYTDTFLTFTGNLNNEGQIETEFKLDELPSNYPSEINVTAVVGDAYGAQSADSAKALLHTTDTYLRSSIDSAYVAEGEKPYLNLEAIDTNCNPIVQKDLKYKVEKVEYAGFKEQTTLISEQAVKTDNFGKFEQQIDLPESSHYKITTSVDTFGKTNEVSKYVWVFSQHGANSFYSNDNSLAVEFDKDIYNVGEIAKATIYHPGISGDLWFTINRDSFHVNEIVELGSYQTEISFEIREEYIPNADLTIGVFSSNKFFSSRKAFQVNDEYKKINIEITPDKETYGPGDEVKLQIKTTNQNEPISSGVTISVVDKAVLDLQKNPYYWRESSIIRTFYPSYYRQASLRNSFLPVDFALHEFGGGAGGGGGDIRKVFGNTAYWNPNIQTNDQGFAEITFTLPDNLTTWGIGSYAYTTSDTKVGENTTYIKSQKDLKIQSFVPENMIVGDKFEISTKVFNLTKQVQDIKLVLELPETIKLLSGESSIPLVLEPGQETEQFFFIEALAAGENNKLIIRTEGGTESDGLEINVNIIEKTYLNKQTLSGFGIKEFSFEAGGEARNLNIIAVSSLKNYLKEIAFDTELQSYIDASEIVAYYAMLKDNKTFSSDNLSSITNRIQNLDIKKLKDEFSDYEWMSIRLENRLKYEVLNDYLVASYLTKEDLGDFSSEMQNIKKLINQFNLNPNEKALIGMVEAIFSENEFTLSDLDALIAIQDQMEPIGLASLSIAAHYLGKNDQSLAIANKLLEQAILEGDSLVWSNNSASRMYVIKEEQTFYMNDFDVNLMATFALSLNNKVDEAKKALSSTLSSSRTDYFSSINLYMYSGIIELDKKTENRDSTAYKVLLNGTELLSSTQYGVEVKADFKEIRNGANKVIIDGGNDMTFVSLIYSENTSEQQENDSELLNTSVKLIDLNGNQITELKEGEYGFIHINVEPLLHSEEIEINITVPTGLEIINENLNNSTIPFSNSSNFKFYLSKYVFGNQSLYLKVPLYFATNNFVIPVRARNIGEFTLGPVNIQSITHPFIWENLNYSNIKVVK